MPSKKFSQIPMGDRPRTVRWTSTSIIEWQRWVLRQAGQDPAVVPDEPFQLLALPEVKRRVALSTSTIYRAMSAEKFPRPVPYPENFTRADAA